MKKGWQTKRLCEVSDVFDGPHATPKTVDSGPIFLGIGALQDGIINLGETRHVTEEDFKKWTRRVLPQPDDVVFSYETRLGQAAIIPEGLECCLGRRMGLVRFKSGAVAPRFFLYQYLSPAFREFLDSKTIRGATVDRFSIKDFPSFPIAVPPLPEQQRIVGLLDEAFKGLATAIANAEKNLHNARALFESHLQSVFTQRGKGWVRTTLEKVLTTQPQNGWSPPAANHSASGPRF
jgi:restriction endonuclease S subunit